MQKTNKITSFIKALIIVVLGLVVIYILGFIYRILTLKPLITATPPPVATPISTPQLEQVISSQNPQKCTWENSPVDGSSGEIYSQGDHLLIKSRKGEQFRHILFSGGCLWVWGEEGTPAYKQCSSGYPELFYSQENIPKDAVICEETRLDDNLFSPPAGISFEETP